MTGNPDLARLAEAVRRACRGMSALAAAGRRGGEISVDVNVNVGREAHRQPALGDDEIAAWREILDNARHGRKR